MAAAALVIAGRRVGAEGRPVERRNPAASCTELLACFVATAARDHEGKVALLDRFQLTGSGKTLLVVGGIIVAIAVAWWWLTYRDVVEYSYLSAREASGCLIGRSDLCDLARALCRGTHPAIVIGYWWGTFWIGVGIVSASLAVSGNRQPRV
jgi:hypothetical protein